MIRTPRFKALVSCRRRGTRRRVGHLVRGRLRKARARAAAASRRANQRRRRSRRSVHPYLEIRTAPRGLNSLGTNDNLVSMTRISKRSTSAAKPAPKSGSGHWLLQDAKARFSELVRKVRSEGPQHVTVHGRDEVVVIAAEDFRRLKGEKTGQALINALQASPCREIDLAPARSTMAVRGVAV